MTEENGGKLVPQEPADTQIEMWGEMVAVERERIASRDRAVEAMREGFARLDATDERQFKFHTDRLHRDDEFRNRQLTHVMHITWVVAGIVVAVMGVILGMMFWGGEEQRNVATLLVTHLLSAGGFFAVGYLLGRRSRS